MTTTVTDLTIGGVKMPDPALEGVTISTEKVWKPLLNGSPLPRAMDIA